MIAEETWDGSTWAPARQYVNGTQYIDERVVMRDVAGGGVDHYYLHEELYSVAGMAASNGMLEEAVVYDTYGEAGIYKWPSGDVDRDGDVDQTDVDTVTNAPTNEPLYDVNLSGSKDTFDILWVHGQMDATPPTLPALRTYSSVGNPYLFTGRTTDTLCATSGLVTEGVRFRRIQDNRNRMYDPHHGRWFQRDPLGVRPDPPNAEVHVERQYVDGMGLHEYVRSSPAVGLDAWGQAATTCPATALPCAHEYADGVHGGIWSGERDYDFGPVGVDGRHKPKLFGTGACGWGGNNKDKDPNAPISSVGVVYTELGRTASGILAHVMRKGKPIECKCATCPEVRACLAAECKEWSGKPYSVIGPTCWSFVDAAKSKCCLAKLR